MDTPAQLLIRQVEHPDPSVQRFGFRLDSSYVEQVWTGAIGPTSVLLLRRLAIAGEQGRPLAVDVAELATGMGVGSTVLVRTFGRLAKFRLARPITDGGVDVFERVGPVPDRVLSRLPESIARIHHRKLAVHLERLGVTQGVTGSPAPRAEANHIRARLDRLAEPPELQPTPGVAL